MPDFSQTNKTLRQALNMMWQMGLMKKRDELSLGRQEKYLTGLEDIGVQRHEQSLARIEEGFQNDIARDPEVEKWKALIFSKNRRGEDTSIEQGKLKKHMYNRALIAFEVGQVSSQAATAMAQTLTEKVYSSVLGEGAATGRQERRITGIEEPKIVMEEKKLAMRGKEFGLKEKEFRAKGREEESTQWLKFVEDVEDHLRQEGVKAEKLFKDALFGTGKVPDPLSPEHRGQAYTYLGKIRIKLIEGKPLTTGDKRFLQTVRSTFQVVKGGGLVSPETGFQPTEATGITEKADTMVEQRLLEVLVSLYMEEGGFTEEQAREKAMKMMTQIR